MRAKAKGLKIPIDIDGAIRNQIDEAYSLAIEAVGEAEWSYVKQRMPRVLKRLRASQSAWVLNLGRIATALFSLLNETDNSPDLLLPETKRVLTAALFYLCNPYDVIPDFTPGIGYVDDAIVIGDCLRRLKKLQPTLYKREFEAKIALL